MSHVFSFNNNLTGNPVDRIRDAQHALSAISLIFIHDRAPDLSDDDASGIACLLQGIESTLRAVADELDGATHGGGHAG
ncbi:MAG: hypothetical protein HQL38_06425 [Alphaproteobacteria bacterium]|nr:hypothetical protein [Alphaproteobacteria bacterium]